MAKSALGKGLGALISTPQVGTPSVRLPALAQPAPGDVVNRVTLDQIVPSPLQPRKEFEPEHLAELMESIREHGIIQPLIVRQVNGKMELIAGERRFRASRELGLKEVPVIIRQAADKDVLEMALIENIQREDLNPLEEAQGLQRLIKEFGLTHETAAQAVGRSRSAASNLLRLLNLAEPVQTMLMAGDLDMGHARALLSLDRATQITAANQITAKKMSVRETESLVKKLSAEFNLVPQKPKKEKSRDIRRVEEELADLLMAEVEVRIKKRVKRHGKIEEMGELSIQFGSLEALNGLIDRLRG